jgi:hypothetical protein
MRRKVSYFDGTKMVKIMESRVSVQGEWIGRGKRKGEV